MSHRDKNDNDEDAISAINNSLIPLIFRLFFPSLDTQRTIIPRFLRDICLTARLLQYCLRFVRWPQIIRQIRHEPETDYERHRQGQIDRCQSPLLLGTARLSSWLVNIPTVTSPPTSRILGDKISSVYIEYRQINRSKNMPSARESVKRDQRNCYIYIKYEVLHVGCLATDNFRFFFFFFFFFLLLLL